MWGHQFDYPVLVERGAREVAFALCRSDSLQPWLYIQHPDGTIVDPSDDSVTLVETPEYQLFVVRARPNESLDGKWYMRIERSDLTDTELFQLLAFSRNPKLHAYLRIDPLDGNGLVRMEATAHAPLPVGHLEPVVAKLTQYTAAGVEFGSRLVQLLASYEPCCDEENVAGSRFRSYWADFERPKTGALHIEVRLANAGRGTYVHDEMIANTTRIGRSNGTKEIPEFTRVLEHYVLARS